MTYPKKRKKKIPHEQYFDTARGLGFGYPARKYFMVYDKGWWACLEGDKGSARITLKGKQYTKVAKVKAYLGANGSEIFGYYRVFEKEHKAASSYNFGFIKEPHAARVIKKWMGNLPIFRKFKSPYGRPKVKPLEIGAYRNKEANERGFLTQVAPTPKPRILRKPKFKEV